MSQTEGKKFRNLCRMCKNKTPGIAHSLPVCLLAEKKLYCAVKVPFMVND